MVADVVWRGTRVIMCSWNDRWFLYILGTMMTVILLYSMTATAVASRFASTLQNDQRNNAQSFIILHNEADIFTKNSALSSIS